MECGRVGWSFEFEWEVRVGLEGLEGLEGSKHPKLSKLISSFLELELVTQTPMTFTFSLHVNWQLATLATGNTGYWQHSPFPVPHFNEHRLQ